MLKRHLPRPSGHSISSYRRYCISPQSSGLGKQAYVGLVWIKAGICSADSLINILLCVLGYIPGLIRKSFHKPATSIDLAIRPLDSPSMTDHICKTASNIRVRKLICSFYTDAWYIISLYPEPSEYEYQTIPQDQGENGRVTYYYVNHLPSQEGLRQEGPSQASAQPQRGYGTTQPMQAPSQQQGGQGSSAGGVPPSYEQAIKGDHKVQTE